jgi:hypothetical protein
LVTVASLFVVMVVSDVETFKGGVAVGVGNGGDEAVAVGSVRVCVAR